MDSRPDPVATLEILELEAVSDNFYSPHWYRVANLTPELLAHVEIRRHDYRGLIWYFLEDTITGKGHRFNSTTYQFIGLMDGTATVQQIFDVVSKKLGDYAPNQDDIVQLLGRMNRAGLIKTEAIVDAEEIYERCQEERKAKLQKQVANPLSVRIPLWDPNSFLDRFCAKVAWVFSPWMGLIWLLLVVYGGIQAWKNWPDINAFFAINSLSPYNLLLMFLIYPLVKLLHELGHAFAAKLSGCEVHEMGINILMFFPVPYVNVSKSRHLRDRRKRILINAAGILVESFLACVGLLVFLNTQPGLLNDIGFNMMVIGGLSSLLFNGNPLLKFDGYYILADALSIPNLYQRSSQYWLYLIQYHLLGQRQVSSPVSAHGEAFWFISFSTCSLTYRYALLWVICTTIAEKFFILGVILAVWLVVRQVMIPLFKGAKFLLTHPGLSSNRLRVLLSSGAFVTIVAGFLFYYPVKVYTRAEGIIWVQDKAEIKADTDGFISAIHVSNEQQLRAGAVVVSLQDAFLVSRQEIARAKLQEINARLRAERDSNMVRAELMREEQRIARHELQHYSEKQAGLQVIADQSGHVLLPDIVDLPGRYVRKGELIGYVLDGLPSTIKALVGQDDIGHLQQHTEAVEVRFASLSDQIFPASLSRKTPEPVDQLPSAALATTGGGKIIVDPSRPEELRTLNKWFVVELSIDTQGQQIPLGSRAYIRFDHGKQALASQWYRRLLQAFLREFNV